MPDPAPPAAAPLSDAELARLRETVRPLGPGCLTNRILTRLDAAEADRDRLLRALADAESRAEDANNSGAEEAARILRGVADRGRSGGTFGGVEVEAAARAVDALRAERGRLAAALRALLNEAENMEGTVRECAPPRYAARWTAVLDTARAALGGP